MNRRKFLAAAGSLAAAPPSAKAQRADKPFVVAYLGYGKVQILSDAFDRGMQDLGYKTGRDYVMVERYANNDVSKLPSLARELLQLRPDCVVASVNFVAKVVVSIDAAVSVVILSGYDFVTVGLIQSQSHPGGNATGIMSNLDGMTAKMVEIGAEIFPGVRRLGVLQDTVGSAVANSAYRREVVGAADKLGLAVLWKEVRVPGEFNAAIGSVLEEHGEGILTIPDPLFQTNAALFSSLALKFNLPTMLAFREGVEAGGLASYGVNLAANWRRGAYFVDRILKGAKPADIPVEFPALIELVVNLKTAKALNLTIPQSILARADDVIE